MTSPELVSGFGSPGKILQSIGVDQVNPQLPLKAPCGGEIRRSPQPEESLLLMCLCDERTKSLLLGRGHRALAIPSEQFRPVVADERNEGNCRIGWQVSRAAIDRNDPFEFIRYRLDRSLAREDHADRVGLNLRA